MFMNEETNIIDILIVIGFKRFFIKKARYLFLVANSRFYSDYLKIKGVTF